MKAKGEFGDGSIAKHMLRLAIPILMAELVNVTYSIVDRVFIGHIEGIGTYALSGVGVVFPLITFINAFAALVSNGGAPLCSIKRGEQDQEGATRILENSFTLILLIGISCVVILYPTMRWTLRWMGADANTFGYAKDYFSIYLVGTIFVLISLGANAFINLQGAVSIGMMTVLIGAILNTILDPLFIFTFHLGVKGAAWATVVAQGVSAIWVVKYLFSRKTPIHVRRLRLDLPVVTEILKLGVSGFMFKMTNTIAQAVCNMTLAVYGGASSALYIGALSIINSLREVYSLTQVALTQGFQPIASYNYGAMKNSRVRKSIRLLFALLFVSAFTSWFCLMFFPRFFVSLFTPDHELIEVTIPCLRVFFAAFFMITCQTCGQHSFVAMNCPSWSVFFSLLRKLFLIVPLTLILPRVGLGAKGVFYAEMISQIVGGGSCFTTMYIVVYRVLKKTADGEKATFFTPHLPRRRTASSL